MAQVKFHKVVSALPAELEADAIYYVRAGAGHDVYVTNGSGMIVGYPANAALGLAGKVDKVAGQSLITDAERTKLSGIAAGATANSTDAQLRNRATHTGTQAISTVTGLQTALDNKINTTERGVSGGVATLDEFARIPSSQLPSYVDDVLEFPTLANFPALGEGGKIYIAVNQGTQANPTRQYRWTGSVYAEINPSPGTTDALTEGSTNLYFSEHRVRNTLLTGLSLLSSAAITAADTVLSALGKLQAQLGQKANLDSPALTGNPTAPTPAADDSDTSIATTAHVKAAISLAKQSSPTDTTAGALMAVGAFGLGGAGIYTSDCNAVTVNGTYQVGGSTTNAWPGAGSGDSLLHCAFSATYAFQIGGQRTGKLFTRAQQNGVWGDWRELFHTGNFDPATKANLASPTFTGNPTAPTPAADDNDTSIATTAHVKAAMALFGVGTATVMPVPNGDLNSVADSGFNRFDNVEANRPCRYGTLLTIRRTQQDATQLAFDRFDAMAVYTRQQKTGVWSAWQELFHTGNFDPTTKQDKSAFVTTATSRTLALADAWNYVRPSTTGAVTLTVPTNAAVAFEIGTEITIRALGSVTLAAASGVTLYAPSGGTLSMTARMTVTLKKAGPNLWDVIGQTVAA